MWPLTSVVIASAQSRLAEAHRVLDIATKNSLSAHSMNVQTSANQDWNQAWAEVNDAENALSTLQKTARAMNASALASLPFKAAADGIDRIFSTGVNYGPALVTAQNAEQAAQAGLFGLDALNNLGSALDDASGSKFSTSYTPYSNGVSISLGGFSGGDSPYMPYADTDPDSSSTGVSTNWSSTYTGDATHGSDPTSRRYFQDANSGMDAANSTTDVLQQDAVDENYSNSPQSERQEDFAASSNQEDSPRSASQNNTAHSEDEGALESRSSQGSAPASDEERHAKRTTIKTQSIESSTSGRAEAEISIASSRKNVTALIAKCEQLMHGKFACPLDRDGGIKGFKLLIERLKKVDDSFNSLSEIEKYLEQTEEDMVKASGMFTRDMVQKVNYFFC